MNTTLQIARVLCDIFKRIEKKKVSNGDFKI